MESNNEVEPTTKSCEPNWSSTDRINYNDALLLPMDKIKTFPAEVLRTILSEKHDIGLMNLALVSTQFELIVRELFAERYANRYFVIEGESERHRMMYSSLLSLFGKSIKAIQANGIRNIDDNHWLVQLLNKHTPNLKKMYFKKCFFKNVDNFLSQHMKITHLTFRDGACAWKYQIQLPEYCNLKSLELFKFPHISKSSLEQVLCDNLQIERLILSSCNHYFTLPSIMELIHNNLKHMKELNILDIYDSGVYPLMKLDQFVDGLTSLESFGVTVLGERLRGLLRRVSSNCKNIKHLELNMYHGNLDTQLIELICTFDKIVSLSLIHCIYQKQLEVIIENMPNLRFLSISNVVHRTNDQILTILRKCKNLEKLMIGSESSSAKVVDESIYKKNLHFHDEFVAAIPNPHTRLEFTENDEVIGIITKDEIIWRNKLLHWVGYDSSQSRSNVQLLDLATVSKGKHKQPLNLIFNYLDLDSLYAFGMASKECKQLVHGYVYQRCKQSSKKRPKQRSLEREKFYMTDEFGLNFDGLRMFGKNIRYLDIDKLDYHGWHDLLKEIEKHCKLLTKLCFRTRYRIDPHSFILPQVRHFIFYGYGMGEDYLFHCELNELSEKCPNLEIFEIRTVARLYTGCLKKEKVSFTNLQKIKFKPFDDSQVEYAKGIFKNSGTEIVIDH